MYHRLFNFSVNLTKIGDTLQQSILASQKSSTSSSSDTSILQTINTFLASRSSLENSSLILALCTFVFLAMSWTSRFGNLGRFSPFTRSPPQGSNKVSDADFSYITAEDLRKHEAAQVAPEASSQATPEDMGPKRDTDVIIFRNKKKEYSVHFPAYSIVKGELTIGQMREQAARKTGADVRKVRLLYKGKNLKDDGRTAKQEGLREGALLMCTIADSNPSASASDDDDEDDEFAGLDGDDNTNADGEARRRRNRGKKSKRRNKREQGQAQSSQTSRMSSPKPVPTTALGKISALRDTLHTFLGDVEKFRSDPPPDAAKRDFEHKRLSETILTQVLLKLDAVEVEGDPDARMKRKELVRETQDVLNGLDATK